MHNPPVTTAPSASAPAQQQPWQHGACLPPPAAAPSLLRQLPAQQLTTFLGVGPRPPQAYACTHQLHPLQRIVPGHPGRLQRRAVHTCVCEFMGGMSWPAPILEPLREVSPCSSKPSSFGALTAPLPLERVLLLTVRASASRSTLRSANVCTPGAMLESTGWLPGELARGAPHALSRGSSMTTPLTRGFSARLRKFKSGSSSV